MTQPMPATISHWQQLTLSALPKLLSALLILAIFVVLTEIIKKYSRHLSQKATLKSINIQFTTKIIQGIMYTVGITSALGSIGVDIRAVITGLGISGFAIGFAMKDIISNFLAGLLILVYRPFKIGNHVEMGGNTGKITEVNMRYTTLISEGNKTLVPNAKLLTDIVVIKKPAEKIK